MLHICFALSYFFVSIYSNNISLYFHLVNKFFLLYTVFMDSLFAKLSQEEKKVLSDYFQNLTTNLIYKGKRPENLSSTGASFVYGKSTRFILLSAKPYSNVSASTLGLKEEDWLEKSMKIRLEHECSHFFTKRFFGNAQNHLHDELIADFFGLLSAFGNYSAEYWESFCLKAR